MKTVIEQSVNALEVYNISNLQKEVTTLLESNQKNYYRIGKILNFLNDNLKKEKYNEWLKKTTNYSKSQLCKYMKIAENYTEKEAVDLGVKKSYLLLKIQDKNEREVFINSNEIRNKSFEDTQQLLMEHLNVVTDNKETKENNDTKILRSADKGIEKILKDIAKLNNPANTELISNKINELKNLIIKAINTENNNNKDTDLIDNYNEDIDLIDNYNNDWGLPIQIP